MQKLRSPRDLIACYILSEHIGYDSALSLVPILHEGTIERIIKKERGFDFHQLSSFFDCYKDDVKREYLKLANNKPELANSNPYLLERHARNESPSVQNAVKRMKISMKLPISYAVTT